MSRQTQSAIPKLHDLQSRINRKLERLEVAQNKLIDWRAHAQKHLQEVKERLVLSLNRQVDRLSADIDDVYDRNSDVISVLEVELQENKENP